jgi:hypothetical protein
VLAVEDRFDDADAAFGRARPTLSATARPWTRRMPSMSGAVRTRAEETDRAALEKLDEAAAALRLCCCVLPGSSLGRW